MQIHPSILPPPETCSQALKAAIKRYNAILSEKEDKWVRIKSQAVPRSSRILLYKQNGESPEAIYKVVLECLTSSDRAWTLSGWHSLFSNVDARQLWDHMAAEVQMLVHSSTPRMRVTRSVLNKKTEASSLEDEEVICVERTTRRKNYLQHIATTIIDPASSTLLPQCPILAAYDIRMSPDDDPGLDSRVTLYYQPNTQKTPLSAQQMSDILEPYIITLITAPLSTLSAHGAPPYIARRESPSCHISTTSYIPDIRLWSLQYNLLSTVNSREPPIAQPSAALNINKMQYGYMSAAAAAQWQSASWERERTSLQLASSLHHRKNSFMSSGGIMKSSYSAVSIHPHSPKLIPKTSPSDHQKLVQGNDSNSLAEAAISNRLRSDIFSSSYTFGTHSHDGSMEDSMPDIVIEIDHQTWSCQSPIDLRLKATTRSRDGSLEQPMQQKMIDKFAQLCVRCYRQRRQDGHHRYFITLHHTPHFQQYITNELLQDADALEGTYDVIEVAIEVQPRKQQQQAAHNGFALFVNGNEWPFRLWESRSWSKSGFARNTSGRRNGGMMDGFDSDSELEDSDSEATASSESDSHSDVENGVFSNDMDAGPLGHLEMTGTANKSENTPTSPVTIETLNCNPSPDTKIMTEVAGPPAAGEAQLLPLDIELDIPVTDPPQLLKMHHYFDSLLQRTGWHILQDPAQANLFVTIKKLDVSGHPTGAFLSESVWRDCSVWDVKAIVCSMGARKLWDPTLEAALFLHQVSPTCSIWHNKTKGFWPVSPRDYVVFSGYYGTPTRVDLCVTSCTSETVGHITLPKNQPGYVRARLDLWAWRLERIDNSTTSVKLINQADLQGWIPSYIPNSFSGQSSDTIMQAHTYFNKHGAPPDLILLQQGSMVDVSYDHNRSSWRCEYIRSTEATIAIANLRDTEMSSTKAEIRLDGRRRTGDKSYNVVIDPPPTRVRATMRAYDPYGWWLEIVHDEEHIIPQRGKILTLIKPGSTLVGQESGDPELSINGVPMPVQKDITTQLKLQQEPGAVQQDGCSDGHSQEQQAQKLQMEQRQPQSPQQHDSLESIIESLPVSPVEHTQRALAFLEKMADQQFGWTTVSEKNKMQVSKRQGSKVPNAMESSSEDIIIPEQSVILKASKVIEGFSVEEVAAVVTDTGKLRTQYDDSIEEIERLLPLTHGCMLVRQVVKGGLFIKAKEVYASACTAIEKVSSTTNPAAKRVLHIEASIPNFPVPKSSKRQQVLFYISGWILEAIDPYTTTNNYPIPSTRVIFVSTLDLGAAVPTFFSNQITLGLHKKIHTLEGYLKQHGSPPYLTQPLAVEGFSGGKLHERIVKELYPDLGIAEWISVSSSFDRTVNSFKSSGIFRLLIPKRNASLAPSKPSNLSAVLKSKRHAPQSMASSPTFGSVGFKGKQSVGGESKENVTTQTGCPSDILSHGSGNNSGEPGGESLLFHLIVDLRSYPKGYEISTRLTRKGDEQKKDLSASLVCRVSERAPEPSQLIAGSKASQKHAIELLLTPVSRLGRDREYILEMDLTRVQEESLNKRGTRLTVSGVLGDEDNQWRGLLLLNGREIKIGANNECAVTTLPEESLLLEDLNGEDESAEEDEETRFSGTGTTNMGGGVVAAAIGGVSAGVSDIRARMLLPFRNASNSFLLSPIRNDSEESDLFSSAFSDSPPNSENGQQQEQQQQQQQQQQEQQHTTASPPSASVLAHAVFKSRRHRSSTNGIPDQYQLHDAQVTAKTIGWLILCLIFLLVFLFYIGSTTSPPLSGVEYTHERHLWSMPWIGGWHIQVRAIRQ